MTEKGNSLHFSMISHYTVNTNHTVFIAMSAVLTYFLQHETCQIGAAASRRNGRDVDDVVGEKFQVGQEAEPHLKE